MKLTIFDKIQLIEILIIIILLAYKDAECAEFQVYTSSTGSIVMSNVGIVEDPPPLAEKGTDTLIYALADEQTRSRRSSFVQIEKGSVKTISYSSTNVTGMLFGIARRNNSRAKVKQDYKKAISDRMDAIDEVFEERRIKKRQSRPQKYR